MTVGFLLRLWEWLWSIVMSMSVGPIANLKGHYCQPSLSVSLCVCLWPALLPCNVDRFWRNLVTRTPLWSSLAATIMIQIGRRGTTRRLCENFEKFSKLTEFEFQILVHHFLRLCLLCIVKKFWLDLNKTDRGDTFWSLPFRQPPVFRRSLHATSVLATGVPALLQQWQLTMCGSRNVASASFRGSWPEIRELGAFGTGGTVRP